MISPCGFCVAVISDSQRHSQVVGNQVPVRRHVPSGPHSTSHVSSGRRGCRRKEKHLHRRTGREKKVGIQEGTQGESREFGHEKEKFQNATDRE